LNNFLSEKYSEKLVMWLDRELKTLSNTLAYNSLKFYLTTNYYQIWIYILKLLIII